MWFGLHLINDHWLLWPTIIVCFKEMDSDCDSSWLLWWVPEEILEGMIVKGAPQGLAPKGLWKPLDEPEEGVLQIENMSWSLNIFKRDCHPMIHMWTSRNFKTSFSVSWNVSKLMDGNRHSSSRKKPCQPKWLLNSIISLTNESRINQEKSGWECIYPIYQHHCRSFWYSIGRRHNLFRQFFYPIIPWSSSSEW